MTPNKNILKRQLLTTGSHLRQISKEVKLINEKIKKLEFIIKKERETLYKKSNEYVIYESERIRIVKTLKLMSEKEKING